MKFWKVIVMIMALSMIGALSVSCASKPESAAVLEGQMATAQRGDLTIDITAVGNLALSLKEDLAFEISGTVEEVTVEEGDSVEEGQVLARLDTSEWEDQLKALEDKVTTAERQLTAAERQLTVKQRELIQAEINLKNATIALEQTNSTYSVSDFKVAQADVDGARSNLEDTLWTLTKYDTGSLGYLAYEKVLVQAQARLNTAEAKLDAMLSGFDTEEVAIKKLQVKLTEIRLDEAQSAIDDAETAIKDAQEKVEDAQEALEEAEGYSAEIIAPFAGFITRVNVGGGDEVKKGTVAVQLADPAKFEADILVSEMDIFQVRLGGDATVQVDAMPMVNLPAMVTHISPTATIQSGVVNYKVKVEIQSLGSVTQQRPEVRREEGQDALHKIRQGELPQRIQQAIDEGRITEAQAEEMMERFQQTIDEGRISEEQIEEMMKERQQGGAGLSQGQQRRVPTAAPQDFQLREGLTVTVSILVEERRDVLLIPNKVIIRRGAETYVQVLTDGVVEERSIRTGISDWQNTEVISGLNEGEEVVIPQATNTPTSQQRGGFSFMGGGGGGGEH